MRRLLTDTGSGSGLSNRIEIHATPTFVLPLTPILANGHVTLYGPGCVVCVFVAAAGLLNSSAQKLNVSLSISV